MPFDLARELDRIATDIAPGALRRYAYQRCIARLEHDRAQVRDLAAKGRLRGLIQHVRFLARTEPDAGAQGAAP